MEQRAEDGEEKADKLEKYVGGEAVLLGYTLSFLFNFFVITVSCRLRGFKGFSQQNEEDIVVKEGVCEILFNYQILAGGPDAVQSCEPATS